MNSSSSLRALLIEWAAMACAVADFVGVALEMPDAPSQDASTATAAARPGP